MHSSKRKFLTHGGGLMLAGAALAVASRDSHSADLQRLSMAVPGPGNLLFLPIQLASSLGMDRQTGVQFDIRFVGGSPQAYKDMVDRNVDFAAGGFAALALQRVSGYPVRAIVPLTRVPAYTLLVRSDLRGKIRRVADLKGKVVGVKGHTPGGRSTSQLFTEYILAREGVAADAVNYVSVGQSFESQQAGLASGAVDAIMGDEPFATRLTKQGTAFVLQDYHDLAVVGKLLGGLFLNGTLATRDDVIANQPDIVEKVVKSLTRTLVWIEKNSAESMVDALQGLDAIERDTLRQVLRIRKNIYSPDGRFSDGQVACVNRFYHAMEDSPAAKAFNLTSLVNSRWSGRAI